MTIDFKNRTWFEISKANNVPIFATDSKHKYIICKARNKNSMIEYCFVAEHISFVYDSLWVQRVNIENIVYASDNLEPSKYTKHIDSHIDMEDYDFYISRMSKKEKKQRKIWDLLLI